MQEEIATRRAAIFGWFVQLLRTPVIAYDDAKRSSPTIGNTILRGLDAKYQKRGNKEPPIELAQVVKLPVPRDGSCSFDVANHILSLPGFNDLIDNMAANPPAWAAPAQAAEEVQPAPLDVGRVEEVVAAETKKVRTSFKKALSKEIEKVTKTTSSINKDTSVVLKNIAANGKTVLEAVAALRTLVEKAEKAEEPSNDSSKEEETRTNKRRKAVSPPEDEPNSKRKKKS